MTTLPSQLRELSIQSDGLTSHITVDGHDISKHVHTVTLIHEAGDIPRGILTILEPSSMHWEGQTIVLVILKCPVCKTTFECDHSNGNITSEAVADITSLDTAAGDSRNFISLIHDTDTDPE